MQNVMTWKYNAFQVDDVIKFIIIYYAFSIFSEYYKEYSNHSKQSIVYKAKLPHILPQGEKFAMSFIASFHNSQLGLPKTFLKLKSRQYSKTWTLPIFYFYKKLSVF